MQLIKSIISLQCMKNEGCASTVFADLSICAASETALNKDELYNPEVMKHLEREFGIRKRLQHSIMVV